MVSQKEQLAGARWLFPDGPLTNQKEDVNNLFMEVVKEIGTTLRQRQHVIKNVVCINNFFLTNFNFS